MNQYEYVTSQIISLSINIHSETHERKNNVRYFMNHRSKQEEEKTLPKILIIDDEKKILDDLTFILELEDYEVITASSGAEGLQCFKNTPGINVVVTDMRMPGMTGMNIVHAVRDINPDIGVVILTSHGDMENAVSAMKEGAFDYINKPVVADKLLFTIENAIRRFSLLDENRRLHEDIVTKNAYLQGLQDSAEQILKNLLPENPPPQFPGVNVAAVYKSCDNVGGDMYDFFKLGDKVFFYIFDVSSHGILAAVITMILKSFFNNLKLLHNYTDVTTNLPELMQKLNLEMIQNTPSNMYATLFVGYYDQINHSITYISGGHIDQYVLHDGKIVPLPSTGTMVGLFDFADFETATHPIIPGDKLLLFTDGLTEVWDGDQIVDADQISNLIEQYASESIDDMLLELYEDIMDFAGDKSLDDDLTIVGFEFI